MDIRNKVVTSCRECANCGILQDIHHGKVYVVCWRAEGTKFMSSNYPPDKNKDVRSGSYSIPHGIPKWCPLPKDSDAEEVLVCNNCGGNDLSFIRDGSGDKMCHNCHVRIKRE